MKQIKIISLYWGFLTGGGVRYAEILDQVGLRDEFDIRHICIRNKGWNVSENILEKINCKSIFITSRFDLSWIKTIAAEVINYQPDIVMTHGFNGHFALCLSSFFLKKNNFIKIASYHGKYYPPRKSRKLLSFFINIFTKLYLQKKIKSVVAVSEFTKKSLSKDNIPSKKIHIIYNGIDVYDQNSKFLNIRHEWGLSEHDFILATISRLDPIKGIEYLLDSLLLLKSTRTNIKVVIIGTGPYEHTLKNYCKKRGLESRVKFVGKRSDIEDCLHSIDCFVLPSLKENHSIALLEAMRAQKPIIATDVGGTHESVGHGGEALLVPAKDPKSLCSSIEKIYEDKKLRERLAANAYTKFIKNFTSEIMVKSTSDWIKKTYYGQ
ncbi:glycosyltransferase family 4 protein [Desulfoplanes sp.]